jgi:hypothetical protein
MKKPSRRKNALPNPETMEQQHIQKHIDRLRAHRARVEDELARLIKSGLALTQLGLEEKLTVQNQTITISTRITVSGGD